MRQNPTEEIIDELMLDSPQERQVVDAIIKHQFDSLLEAFTLHRSIEFSGFCKFHFNEKRANAKMNKFRELEILHREGLKNAKNEKERRKHSLSLNSTLENIKHLELKLKKNE